ncbi:MAG: PAS domain S-box protein, partial [Bacteroidota bacterium]
MKEVSTLLSHSLLISVCLSLTFPKIVFGTDSAMVRYQQLQLKDPLSLQSHLIKSIAEDELGYLWLVTDAGLLRYDQPAFRLFEQPNQLEYPKSILRSQNGAFWLLGDMGLLQMKPQGDSLSLELKVAGASKMEAGKIHYGKNLFEDSKGTLWLGGIQDIYRYQSDTLYTYPLGGRFWTEDFDHGFAFTEDKNGRLWAASYTGQIGYYEPMSDAWIWLAELGVSQVVGFSYDAHNQCFWLGANEGVMQLFLDQGGLYETSSWVQKNHPVTSMSLFHGQVWWSDNNGNVFMRPLQENAHIQAGAFPGQEVSGIYASDPFNVWIATDNGLGLIYPRHINPISNPDIEAHRYIESVIRVGETIYYCDRYKLYRQQKGKTTEVLLDDSESYLLGLAHADDKIWIFSRQGLRTWSEGKIKWVNQEVGDFFMPGTDADDKVWVCHMDRPGVSRFDSNQVRHLYHVPDAPDLSMTVVRRSPAGTLYFGGQGPANLLYRYDPEQDKLVNLLVNQPLPEEIKVQDIAIGEDEKIWLATNVGLYSWQQGNKVLQPHAISANNQYPSIVAIHWQSEAKIWLANGGDLILFDPYSEQQYTFNRWNGLPNADLAAHNLKLMGDRLLIGTHRGLFQLDTDWTERSARPAPIWKLSKQSLDQRQTQRQTLSMSLKSQIDLKLAMKTEYGRMVEYRYRIESKSPHWKYISAENPISYKAAKTGADQIEVQARRYGPFKWSDSQILKIDVGFPWYLNPIFWLVGIMCMAFTIYASLRIRTKFFERKEADLQNLVDSQTHALQEALIRERKITSALQQSEARYRMLFESARDGIMILKDDKVIDANEQAWRMFGYDRESFFGISLRELYPSIQPDGRISEEKALRQLARSRWDAHYEHWKQKRKDGTLFDAEISLNRMKVDGEYYTQVIFRNITERIEAREERTIFAFLFPVLIVGIPT